MTPSSQQSEGEKLVCCWNCKHLTTLYLGEPRDGRLFEKTVGHCKVKNINLERRCDVIVLRRCREHEKVGLSNTPPEYWLPGEGRLTEAD